MMLVFGASARLACARALRGVLLMMIFLNGLGR